MPAPFTNTPVTFLAPMQDITDAGFMEIVKNRGAPDFYIAEYFRIHEFFELDPHVLNSVLWSPDCVSAQFIGEDESFIARAIDELKKYPQIKMLDLNLGCPAPKVYKKNVGGGLLRDPKKIASIMRVMRSNWDGCFSVKMRTGFDSDANFADVFKVVLDGSPDFISLHARTVKQLYKGTPNYDKIAEAVQMSNVPVIANGDIVSAQRAYDVIQQTGCAGVMVGRHAVRNPWIFRQIADKLSGREIFVPRLAEVRKYVDALLANIQAQNLRFPDSRLKKFLNFVGASIDPNGDFLFKMRRARGLDELLKVCDEFMVDNNNADKPFHQEPYEGVCSRPNCEL